MKKDGHRLVTDGVNTEAWARPLLGILIAAVLIALGVWQLGLFASLAVAGGLGLAYLFVSLVGSDGSRG